MSSDINLLSNINPDLLKRKKGLRIVRMVSALSLAFVAIASIIIFILNSTAPLFSIKKEQDLTLQKISLLKDRQAKIAIINNRILGITEIIKKRSSYYKVINTILERIPNEISIQSLRVDKKTLALTLTSNSLQPIQDFINNLISMAKKKELINTITLDSLTLSEKNSSYFVSIKANLY